MVVASSAEFVTEEPAVLIVMVPEEPAAEVIVPLVTLTLVVVEEPAVTYNDPFESIVIVLEAPVKADPVVPLTIPREVVLVAPLAATVNPAVALATGADTTVNKPAVSADTATTAMRCLIVLLDIFFLSLVELGNFPISARRSFGSSNSVLPWHTRVMPMKCGNLVIQWEHSHHLPALIPEALESQSQVVLRKVACDRRTQLR
jgi:hypothetical protein